MKDGVVVLLCHGDDVGEVHLRGQTAEAVVFKQLHHLLQDGSVGLVQRQQVLPARHQPFNVHQVVVPVLVDVVDVVVVVGLDFFFLDLVFKFKQLGFINNKK